MVIFANDFQRAGKNGGGWGEEIFAREQNRGQPRRLARSEQSQAKYSFPF